MPILNEFRYYGHAVGVDGRITRPIAHVIDAHGRCALPDHKPGHHSRQHGAHSIPEILSYDGCRTEVHAAPEDEDGFFRTEIRATVENVRILGDLQLTADRISMGMVSMYRRHWYEQRNPPALSVRVLPIDCSLGNLTINGRPAREHLPAPFLYTADRRESYLRGDHADPEIETEVQKAIADGASRFVHIPNFGRIFFGEWTIASDGASEHVHRISMLRLALGSPVAGALTFSSGDGDGSPPPPP